MASWGNSLNVLELEGEVGIDKLGDKLPLWATKSQFIVSHVRFERNQLSKIKEGK